MTIKDSQQAFGEAIERGYLSSKKGAPNYAGNYMYMYTDAGREAFKHIDTRRYLYVPAS